MKIQELVCNRPNQVGPVSVYTYLCAYVCSCMCMYLPRGAYLCHV